jgi:hypothetical protein
VRRHPLVRRERGSAMSNAAIADPGLDRHEGDMLGFIASAADGLPREKGWSADQQAFVQQHGSGMLDSSLLRMSSVGFASPYDPMWAPPRRRWTVQLISDRLVDRYDQRPRRPAGLRGHLLALLVLLRRRACPGGPTGGRVSRSKDADPHKPLRPVLGRDHLERCADRQLPTGVHPPRPRRRRDHSTRPRSGGLPMTGRARVRLGLAASSRRSPTGSRGR